MKICSNCGEFITENSRFCSSCGAPVSADSEKKTTKSSNSRVFKVAISITSVLIVLCITLPLYSVFARDTKVKESFNAGNKYLSDGRYEEAILVLEKTIGIDKKNIPARIGIAKASTAMKNYDKAFKMLGEVLEIQKDNPEAAKMLFDLYFIKAKKAIENKKYNEAEESVNNALKLDNKNVSFYIDNADLYNKQGETNKAKEILEKGFTNTGDDRLKSMLEDLQNMGLGNSQGNIANSGMVVEKDNWIYIGAEDGIYKVNKNNRNTKHKVVDTEWPTFYLNIDSDYLYFITYNNSNQNTINKVRFDGSELVTLADDVDFNQDLILKNDRLYYINKDRNIISINTSGEDAIVISRANCWRMSISNEWIYYIDKNDTVKYPFETMHGDLDEAEMGKIYRVKLDGSGKEKICDDGTDFIIVDENYIYYTNGNDGQVLASEGDSWHEGKLYRLDLDGANKKKLLDYACYAVNVTDGYIYAFADFGLLRIDKNTGKEQTLRTLLWGYDINTIDGELFFTAFRIPSENYSKYDFSYHYVYGEDVGFEYYSIRLDKDFTEDNTDFIIPYSSARKLTVEDLDGLTKEQLDLARNEIFARYGYEFNADKYKSYFESKPWYFSNPSYSEDMLSEVEKYNAEFIKNYE
jgi:Tfp pilus assembly protein PilF